MIIGLTGGMACGKSTAGAFLKQAGWGAIDADRVVHHLLSHDPKLSSQVVAQLGPEVGGNLSAMLDKKKIAAVVFNDAAKLARLEALLHPRVHAYWQNAVAANPTMPWAIELPLLFENHLESHFDYTVCIAADSQKQWSRLADRGLTSQEAQARIQHQLPLEDKIKYADYVVLNNGSLKQFKAYILELSQQLLLKHT